MRAWLVPGLLLTVSLFAEDFPHFTGFVNDFADQLPLESAQALEQKLRAYERRTGNEVAVAIVPSLNGMTVDDYARGLFRAWGVGKYGVDNGVLFLWAPKERKFRIEVGRGLEGVLTNAEAQRIDLRVRGLFRANRYEDGVNAAVDGILETLGAQSASGAPSAGSNFVDRNSPEELERRRQEEARLVQEREAARAESMRNFYLGLAAAVVLGIGLVMFYRGSRAARWREELPHRISVAEQALADLERKRAEAQVAFLELRKEAPEEVWQSFDTRLSGAPNALAQLRADLDRVLTQPRQTYGQLHAVNTMLARWQSSLHDVSAGLDQVPATLQAFRERREEARRMLEIVPSTLVRLEAQGLGGSGGMLQAAADTYGQALEASRRDPPNWLLVYDLLTDVTACLEQIENPSMATSYQPARSWWGYSTSPAADAMAMILAASMAQRSRGGWVESSGGDTWDGGGSDFGSGGDSGGGDSGGGGDFGGFGGCDSGGGGSSSDY
jgi:uncharacterized membrane protein YgcG